MTPPDFDAQKAAHRGLVETTDHRAKSATRYERDIDAQAEAIRAAFAAGVAPHEIKRVTGLSRTRIYEIRDAADNARASQRLAEVLAMPDDDKE